MDSESANLFEDEDPVLNDSKNDSTAGDQSKTSDSGSLDPVRDIENWFMSSLKAFIPEDMHSIYINGNNVLFSCGSLEQEQFDLKRQTECVYEMTNRGKRSVLSCFDTFTYYTNLTYRNEAQRKRVSLDHMTDPAFLRVIEPRTGKFIISNLIKCASQQQKGLRSYLEHVKKNIFSFPLLEELNRFALSQKLAYKSARQKLWFIMSLAEELKLVEVAKSYKKYSEKEGVEVNRHVLDKNVTLRYFKTAQKQEYASSQSSKPDLGSSQASQSLKLESMPNQTSQADTSVSQIPNQSDMFSSGTKLLGDPIVESTLGYSQMDTTNSVSVLGSVSQFGNNSSFMPEQMAGFTADVSMLNSFQDSTVSAGSEAAKAIGFSALHIGEMSTPLRKNFNFENKQQVDSFDRNFMKLIDEESTPLFEFDNFMEGSKSQFSATEGSQTGWKGLKMIKKSKIKIEEPRMGHFVQRGLDRFVKKKQSFAFKNAVTTISVLEAACKLYGKGPKWSNPNLKEFDLANKTKKLVYVKPSKSVREADLTYQYMLQYASVHQKLNGGVRQEHAVQYGIIEVHKPSASEPRSYTVNTEPWALERFEKKWQRLAAAINFSPWLISKFSDQSAVLTTDKPSESLAYADKQSEETTVELAVDSVATADEIQVASEDGAKTDSEVPKTSQDSDVKSPEDDQSTAPVEQPSREGSVVQFDESQVLTNTQTLSQMVKTEPSDDDSKLPVFYDTQLIQSQSQVFDTSQSNQAFLYSDTQIAPELLEDAQKRSVKTEVAGEEVESVGTSSTAMDPNEDMAVDTQADEDLDATNLAEPTDEDKPSEEQVAASEQTGLTEEQNKTENKTNNLIGPDGKQMKLTELFKYVYNKINKAKDLPEFPELKLINRFNPAVKAELENFSHMEKEVHILPKRRKVLDDEFAEPMPENYVKIGAGRSRSGESQMLLDSDDEDYKRVDDDVKLGSDGDGIEFGAKPTVGFAGKHEVDTTSKSDNSPEAKDDEAQNKTKQAKKPKISRKEKIMRMREIMKSMIEFEAIESEDENLSDPEEIKRSLELLKDKLMNPSESESEIESETEIAKEMKDFIGDVEINEEDEELARIRFNEDQMLADDAELKKVMAFKEKGELELTRREERLRMLEELKKSQKSGGYHLSDFESSDDESGSERKIRVKVTGEDIDRLLRFKQSQREMSKQEQLEQFIDYKLTEANIKLPSVDEVPVSTSFIEVPKATQTHEPVNKIKTRRDMVDNMFNEGLDSIFSNIEEYKSDSSFTVNPFGTPNRTLDKLDNSTSKSPKKPALVMKSFRWDHSQAKPGNTTTVRNFRGFTGFHNLASNFVQNKANNK